MRFGRRDHESYIGGYDPEHEMPNPDRDPRERWQSDAYRRNSADTRWSYRWNPDRFEERGDFGWREPRRMDRDIQPRDRYDNRYSGMPWDRERERYGFRGDGDRNRGMMDRDRDRWDYDRERGGYYGRDFDRRPSDFDRGPSDYDRDRERRPSDYDRERERWARDPWSSRDRYDRERFGDDWEWMGGEWDREGRYGRGGGNRY